MRSHTVVKQKLHVKKGDLVHVRAGNDRGKQGKVLEVLPAKGRVVIDGVNIIKKHTRPSQSNPQGGVVESPGSIHGSNVSVVCPNCNEPTRVAHRRAPGQAVVRVCKRCEKSID